MFSGNLPIWRRHPELRRFVTFLAVGALNTVFGYAIFAALILSGLPTPAAVALGTVIGVVFNYFSTGQLVFGDAPGNRLPRFLMVYAVQMVISIAALTALEGQGLHPLVAALFVLPPVVVLTYLAMRYFVYR